MHILRPNLPVRIDKLCIECKANLATSADVGGNSNLSSLINKGLGPNKIKNAKFVVKKNWVNKLHATSRAV